MYARARAHTHTHTRARAHADDYPLSIPPLSLSPYRPGNFSGLSEVSSCTLGIPTKKGLKRCLEGTKNSHTLF